MAVALFAWIGATDIRACENDGAQGQGPIAQVLLDRTFDHVVLLNSYAKEKTAPFERWIRKKTKASVVVEHEALSSPTDHGEIYRAVMSAVTKARAKFARGTRLVFHLSPGTPAMAAVWIIAAKTQFDAELVESSTQAGVKTVNVPFELAAEFIPSAVRRTEASLERASIGLRPEEPKFGDILHRSESMKRLIFRARQAAAFTAPVLIEGESGTGKELLASAIHKESARSKAPFVVVNCGAIPKELVESAFFGHVRGAFTGAVGDQSGYFEQAHGGSLFLDEVGEMPLDAQVKLLRVLQEKRVRRVGGKSDIAVDVRVISATNRDLLVEVSDGRFREDLFYRLAMLVLKTPPLREREGDVGLLLDRILEKLKSELGASGTLQKKLSPAARNLLLRHAWPGNVRELEATLLRACVWSKGPTIDEIEAREALLTVPRDDRKGDKVLGRLLGDGFSLNDTLAEVSRHYLKRALEESGGSTTKAAALVGLANYQTFSNWVEKYEAEG